jgi:hypothetical protein
VTAGDTPTGGAGVTGTLGTIVRTDNGATQVTYNGLPLYFFINDKAPGDTLGIYTNWRAIVLAAEATAAPSPTAEPTQAPQAPQATPPPTSTAPGDGSPRGNTLPLLLLAGVGALGFLAAIRRLATARR